MASRTLKTALAGCGTAALLLAGAQAATTTYTVNFTELNASGVSGSGTLVYVDDDPDDDVYGTLRISLSFTGLDAGPHPMHIHGAFAGGATANDTPNVDSVTPTIAADSDGDGFIETVEGVPAYGDVLLPLVTDPGNPDALLMADGSGVTTFDQVFDLSDLSIFLPSPATGMTYNPQDLFPLVLREIVIHGMVVADDAGGGDFELTGDNCDPGVSSCFVALLPVAAAEIMASPVPIPGAFALFLSAGVAGGAFRFSRKR